MSFAKCKVCGKVEIEFSPKDEGWKKSPTGGWLCREHVTYGAQLMEQEQERVSAEAERALEGFTAPEDGSADRYHDRKKKVPWARHTFWWVVHNSVAHPLIAVLPVGPMFNFHDWTSRKMHGK